jgi:hypothetical protein
MATELELLRTAIQRVIRERDLLHHALICFVNAESEWLAEKRMDPAKFHDPVAQAYAGALDVLEQLSFDGSPSRAAQAILVAAERALYDDALILKLDDALAKAVEVIKQWHNMGGGEDVWQIYYDNAPEMKLIRETLTRSTDRRE